MFAPAIQGASDGLELQWWAVRGDLHELADFPSLQPWASAAATSDAAVEPSVPLWPVHGLRVFTIALEDLPELERRLGVVEGASTTGVGVQRQWLGQATSWETFIEGPERGPIGVWMETGPLALPAGRLRLLGRAWTEPVPGSAGMGSGGAAVPTLRIELAPQHVEPVPADPLGLAPPSHREPVDEGLIFRRLATAMHVVEGRAVVIIPERPEVTWGERTETAEEPATDVERGTDRGVAPFAHVVRAEPERAPRSGQAGSAGGGAEIAANVPAGLDEPAPAIQGPSLGEAQVVVAGPMSPRLPTLGEAMLMSHRTSRDGSVRSTRIVVVLIPRLPGEYRLLPH